MNQRTKIDRLIKKAIIMHWQKTKFIHKPTYGMKLTYDEKCEQAYEIIKYFIRCDEYKKRMEDPTYDTMYNAIRKIIDMTYFDKIFTELLRKQYQGGTIVESSHVQYDRDFDITDWAAIHAKKIKYLERFSINKDYYYDFGDLIYKMKEYYTEYEPFVRKYNLDKIK